MNKIKFVKLINLLHVSAPWCQLQWLLQPKEIQEFPEVFILCDTEQQDTFNCNENIATYGCVK